MRISDWSSDVCSSDLILAVDEDAHQQREEQRQHQRHFDDGGAALLARQGKACLADVADAPRKYAGTGHARSEEHTSELQSLMRISYAVFCLNKKTTTTTIHKHIIITSQDQPGQ